MPILHIKNNLFNPSTDNECLVHCVSRDFKMSAGIAIEFRNRFGCINNLLSQNVPIGGIAILKQNNRHIFYLVTKERYFLKPTYTNLKNSLICLKNYCEQNNIFNLNMPKIGCGLDKLEWPKVEKILDSIFPMSKFYINVYSL